MKRFTTDMTDAPVHAFAAPHKILVLHCGKDNRFAAIQPCRRISSALEKREKER
jgi:hypothetical protein